MAKVLKANASIADAYVEQDLGATYDDLWVTVDVLFASDALAAWLAGEQSGEFCQFTDALSNYQESAQITSAGFVWPDEGWASGSIASNGASPIADAWQTLEMHRKVSASQITELYVNGSLIGTSADLGNPTQFVSVGQEGTVVNDATGVVYIRNPRVGTTRGASDVYADDFSSGDLSAWTNTVGDVSVVDDPLPSVSYSVTYDGNGGDSGSAPIDGSSPYEATDTVTVLDQGSLGKTDSVFAKWNLAADGSDTDYAPGDTFSMPSSDLTLYAQWVPSPEPPVELPGEVEESWIALEPHWMFLLDQRGSLWAKMRGIFSDYLQQMPDALNRWWLGMDMAHIVVDGDDDSDLRHWEEMLGIPVNPVWTPELRRTLLQIRWFKGPFTRTRRNQIIELFLAAFAATSSDMPIEFGLSGMPFDVGGTAFGVEASALTGTYNVIEDIPDFSYEVRILDTYYTNGFDDTDLARELDRITPAPITFTIVSTPTP